MLDTGPQSITEGVSILELMFSNYRRAFLPLVNEESSSQINTHPPQSHTEIRGELLEVCGLHILPCLRQGLYSSLQQMPD